MQPEVGFFFVLLDVQTILSSQYFPVDMTQLVARCVLTVLQELDALAEVGAAMHARQKPFDNTPRR